MNSGSWAPSHPEESSERLEIRKVRAEFKISGSGVTSVSLAAPSGFLTVKQMAQVT